MRRFNFICPDARTDAATTGACNGLTRRNVHAASEEPTGGQPQLTHVAAAMRRRDRWQTAAALLAVTAAWVGWGMAISADGQLGGHLTWSGLLITTVLPAALSIGALLLTALQTPAAATPKSRSAVARLCRARRCQDGYRRRTASTRSLRRRVGFQYDDGPAGSRCGRPVGEPRT